MENQQIIELYWRRDEAALRETKDKYENFLMQIAHHVLRSVEDSAECVNDTYLSAWNAIPPHRPRHLPGFLGKIARQLAIDRYRRENRQKRKCPTVELAVSELADCIPDKGGVEEELNRAELARAIGLFLSRQRSQNRILFLGRYFYNLSIEELAQQLGLTPSAVKSSLLRTRRKLKAYLEQEGILDG